MGDHPDQAPRDHGGYPARLPAGAAARADRGQHSPYYHPILPLLIDSDSAREPSPWLHSPGTGSSSRRTPGSSLRLAIQQYEGLFGRPPAGMWPSEGCREPGVVDLLAQFPEIRWMATDEAILSASLHTGIERNGWGYLSDPRFLYQPYWVRSGDHRAAMIFRDHYLSDRIGFTYQGWSGAQAAEDLMFRLPPSRRCSRTTRSPTWCPSSWTARTAGSTTRKTASRFLRALYERLSEADWVRTVTVSEFLQQYPPQPGDPPACHRLLDQRQPGDLDRRGHPEPGMGLPPADPGGAGEGRGRRRRSRRSSWPGRGGT